MKKYLTSFLAASAFIGVLALMTSPAQAQDITSLLSHFLVDLRAGTLGVNQAITTITASGTVTGATVTATGAVSGATVTATGLLSGNAISSNNNILAGTYVQTGNSIVTVGADAHMTNAGDITQERYQATITPAGGVDCAASFKAAALTADCTIATLPAGMKLMAIYADVTVGFTCSGTCTGTKVLQAGSSAGAVDILAASFNVATTGQAGLADATLGTAMVRAAAIQGGFLPSWSGTTPVSVRFTSGTGNWGNATTTFVNAGSVKFTLITEQIK